MQAVGKVRPGFADRRALDSLEECYRKQRQNLEDGGYDPNTARVSLEDWHNAMQSINADRSNRYKLRKVLEERGYVRIEGHFAYLTNEVEGRGSVVVGGKTTTHYHGRQVVVGGSVSIDTTTTTTPTTLTTLTTPETCNPP
jgi:hypothetical protein